MEMNRPYLCTLCQGITAKNTCFDYERPSLNNVYTHHPSLVSLELSAWSGCVLCSYLVTGFHDGYEVESFQDLLTYTGSRTSSVKSFDPEILESNRECEAEELGTEHSVITRSCPMMLTMSEQNLQRKTRMRPLKSCGTVKHQMLTRGQRVMRNQTVAKYQTATKY